MSKFEKPGVKWLLRLGIFVASLILTLSILEIVCRLFLKVPPSVSIENLQDANKTGVTLPGSHIENGKIITKQLPDFGLYLFTRSGIRLKRSVTAIVKNHQLSGKDVTITTNSLGYRYRELGPKKNGEFRILDLGDSITLGDYDQAEDTYPAAIERYLKAHRTSALQNQEIEAINAGVGGIDLQNYFAILMETGLSIQPDVVIVGLYLNDADISPALQITHIPAPFNRSHLFRLLFGNLDTIRARFRLKKWESQTAVGRAWDEQVFVQTHPMSPEGSKPDMNTEEGFNRLIDNNFNDWGYAWSEGYWKRILPLVDSMTQVCKEKNIRLVFLFLPIAPQVERKELRNEPQTRFESEMSSRGIAHLDLLPALREEYVKFPDLYYDHCHFKPKGNEFVGETIGRYLTDRLLR